MKLSTELLLNNVTTMESLMLNRQFLKLMTHYTEVDLTYVTNGICSDSIPYLSCINGDELLVVYRYRDLNPEYVGEELRKMVVFEYTYVHKGALFRECFEGELKDYVEVEFKDDES